MRPRRPIPTCGSDDHDEQSSYQNTLSLRICEYVVTSSIYYFWGEGIFPDSVTAIDIVVPTLVIVVNDYEL